MDQNTHQSRIIALLKIIWPTFHRILNSIVYFIIHIIKSTVKSAIDQIKGSF